MNSLKKVSISSEAIILLILILVSSCSTGSKGDKDSEDGKYVKTDVAFWLTKADSTVRFERQNTALNFSSKGTAAETIIVDTASTFQTMDGFGGAMTGGSAFLINRLPAEERNKLLQELFSVEGNSIGISFLRISIGSSDLNSDVFSYDDIDPEQTDLNLEHFDITPDTYDLIPVLQSVKAINPELKIIASPWSAPTWMKTNKKSIGGSLKPEYYEVYSKYFVRYIQAMKEKGIVIDAVTIQNEPEYGGNNPSMLMTAVEQAEFVKKWLGPAFRSAGLGSKIVIYDHNCDHPVYPISILNDTEAAQYIDGSAFHLYTGDISALSQVHAAFPEKKLYFTEQWVGGSATNNFSGDLQWHVKNLAIGAPQNWSSGVIWWNLASDPHYQPHTPGGCDKCLGTVTIGQEISRNVGYYIIAHSSKFVRPGSVRIGSSAVNGLASVAYKTPDGKKVLVVLNESGSAMSFNIRYGEKDVSTSLDGGSVATFIW